MPPPENQEIDEESYYKTRLGATRRTLAEMRDEDLASWQSGQRVGSAQFILADQEWQSRRLSRQISAAYWVSIIGVLGTILGVALGWYLRSREQPSAPLPIHGSARTFPEDSRRHKESQDVVPSDIPKASPIIPPKVTTDGAKAVQQQPNANSKP